MGAVKLYKYLDFTGGLMMLHYSNLQFTNATQLNDPFDCHPSLIDFSNVPKEACGGWTPEIIEELRRDPFRRTREEVWVCSLSKIYDSILMWSYYSKHWFGYGESPKVSFENIWKNHDWLFCGGSTI